MNNTFEDQFWLAEYVELWARYRQIVDQLVANERYALVFSGVVWAWVFANKNEDLYVLVSWVPLVVTLFFFVKGHFFLYKAASQIVAHISNVAEKRKELGELAWLLNKEGDVFPHWQLLFWGTLCTVNFAVAIFFTWLS